MNSYFEHHVPLSPVLSSQQKYDILKADINLGGGKEEDDEDEEEEKGKRERRRKKRRRRKRRIMKLMK